MILPAVRRVAFALGLLALLSAGVRAETPSPGSPLPPRFPIGFHGGLEAAWQRAASKKIPLTIMFTRPDCVPCVRMETELAARPDMSFLWQHGVFVVLDLRNDDAGQGMDSLLDRLRIDTYPAFAILDVSERPAKYLGRIVGYQAPDEFLKMMSWAHPYLRGMIPDWPAAVARGDFASTYVQALAAKMPLVAFFTSNACGACRDMQREIVNNPRAAILWEKAVFTVVDTTGRQRDPKLDRLLSVLHVRALPSFIVMNGTPARPRVCGRLKGYRSQERLFRDLGKIDLRLDPDDSDSSARCEP